MGISLRANLKGEKRSDQKPFYILSGDDATFNSFMSKGGDGVISVAANILPAEIAKICYLNLNHQLDDAQELNKIFSTIYELLFIESNPIPVKWMLERMNKIEAGLRLPLIPLGNDYKEKLLNEMIKLKLL